MTSHTLGIFKKIFPAEGPGLLACQLHTGTTYFNYTTPEDATIKTSTNNLSGKDGQQGFTNASQRWDDGTRKLVTNFVGTNKWPAPPEPDPALAISLAGGNQIIKLKSYIAKTYATFENTPMSPGHITTFQDIDETDPENPFLVPTEYIVWYRLRFSGSTIIFEQHKTLLDENIDQETIIAAPQSNVAYFAMGTDYQKPATLDPLGKAEKFHHLSQQNRILGCNKAGTKTLLFAEKKNSSGEFGSDYQIFEVTDIPDPDPLAETPVGDTFEINLHSTYVASQATGGDADKTPSGSQVVNVDVTLDKAGCDSYITWDQTNLTDGSGSEVANPAYDPGGYSVFLGVAYDRNDDSILILDKVVTNVPQVETNTWYEDINSTQTDAQGADTILTTGEQISSVIGNKAVDKTQIRINGAAIITLETWQSYDATLSYNWTYTYGGGADQRVHSSTSNYSSFEQKLTDYGVLDLGSKLIITRVEESSYSGTYSSSVVEGFRFNKDGVKSDKIYMYANGQNVALYDSAAADSQSFTRVAGKMTGDVTNCSGDCTIDYTCEGSANQSYTATTVYTHWSATWTKP